MKNTSIFKFILINLKRITSYLPSALISTLIILIVCGFGAFTLSSKISRNQEFSSISAAYYLPEDDDLNDNLWGVDLVEGFGSIGETLSITRVMSIEEGYKMLDDDEALFFIIIPENFFSSVHNADLAPMTIVMSETYSVNSFVIRQLISSYSKYLAIEQTCVHAMTSIVFEETADTTLIQSYKDDIEDSLLVRIIARPSYIKTQDTFSVNNFSILETYLAGTILMALTFTCFVLTPMHILNIPKINKVNLLISNFVNTAIIMYIIWLPCQIAISIYNRHFNAIGLITIIPVVLILSLFVSCISRICPTVFSANIAILIMTLILAYIGGIIIPDIMLPDIVNRISDIIPVNSLLNATCRCLY